MNSFCGPILQPTFHSLFRRAVRVLLSAAGLLVVAIWLLAAAVVIVGAIWIFGESNGGKANLLQLLAGGCRARLVAVEIADAESLSIVDDGGSIAYLGKTLQSAHQAGISIPGMAGHSRPAVFHFADGSSFSCTIAPFRNRAGLELFVFVRALDADATRFEAILPEPVPDQLRETLRLVTAGDVYVEE